MQINFYHLTQSPLERALPHLLAKAHESGKRVLVKVSDEARMASLDKALWTYQQLAFLPHASEAHPEPQRQPILLTTSGENKNGADIYCITDGSEAPKGGYDRVIDMFNGQDEAALNAARGRWKQYNNDNAELKYYQQTDSGWEEKL